MQRLYGIAWLSAADLLPQFPPGLQLQSERCRLSCVETKAEEEEGEGEKSKKEDEK